MKKITTAELAATLGWNYEDTQKVKSRKSPKARYEVLLEAESKIIAAKEELRKAIQQEANERLTENTN
ncbi:hypothetical protein ACK2M7_12815 [Chryseobacterium sp. TY4]